MKALMVFTGGGSLVILTSHASPTDPVLIKKLEAKGIDKFIAHEIPIELAKTRYGTHFTVVARDLHESDDLRVLDYNGERAFKLFSFAEMGAQFEYESDAVRAQRERTVRAAEDVQ
jgi:hypothetical protein